MFDAEFQAVKSMYEQHHKEIEAKNQKFHKDFEEYNQQVEEKWDLRLTQFENEFKKKSAQQDSELDQQEELLRSIEKRCLTLDEVHKNNPLELDRLDKGIEELRLDYKAYTESRESFWEGK